MKPESDRNLPAEYQKLWEASKEYQHDFQPDVDKAWASFASKIREVGPVETEVRRLSPWQNWPRWAAILIPATLMTVAIWYWLNGPTEKTFVTAAAETTELTLPDGTLVTLNENSRVSFPEKFSETRRTVHMEGEAFYEVKKDANRPFVILTSQCEIRVLGTAFNLRAYAKEGFTEVQVADGLVKMRVTDTESAIKLERGAKGLFDHKGKMLRKTQSGATNPGSWKFQNLHFENTPLNQVLADLERHFGIDFEIENANKLSDCRFTTNFSNQKLELVLATIEKAFDCKIKPTNKNSYRITGGNCQR
jgi:ferric-dicitrate binding protein FerR (iron transport regulator)